MTKREAQPTPIDEYNMAAHLRDVLGARQQYEAAMSEAQESFASALRSAQQAGVPVIEIARALGLTRQRIYQIIRGAGLD